jgi:hypothetical protein
MFAIGAHVTSCVKHSTPSPEELASAGLVVVDYGKLPPGRGIDQLRLFALGRATFELRCSTTDLRLTLQERVVFTINEPEQDIFLIQGCGRAARYACWNGYDQDTCVREPEDGASCSVRGVSATLDGGG